MAVYLIDPAVLGQIVDGIINEKYPGNEVSAEFKERAMLALDNQILRDILANLTSEQGQELNALLDQEDSTSETFEKFFAEQNIDLEKILKATMEEFKSRFDRKDDDEKDSEEEQNA